ncbi:MULTISPECIES: alpha/beta fold hydrolase [Gammaproteobacteria]|uniref:alpha/beta fold hydrolase n=1 Tax=Gammaproteobacteria TaxID=1236 RepID=UPI000DD01EDE|nr:MULTISPECIES: alpha/beta hydrolase [Gammaproteobacteria]RTE87625.1 alpha/beta hydrolase [Aliidiomarina sp. B3213]TCZ92590.1 alpha/beta hydrolase [Lysobacter sp. N42]
MKDIVALHSSQSRGSQWRGLAKSLAQENLELATPDLIGYGKFAGHPLPSQPFRFAHEISALQDQGYMFEQKPFVLVGHSYGGALALNIALHFQELVKGLVLYEPVSFHTLTDGSEAHNEIVSVATAMEELSIEQACGHFVDYWNTPGYFAGLPEPIQRLMIRQHQKVNLDFDALINQPTTLEDYGQLSCPVVLFSGHHSPHSSQEVARLLKNTLPNATSEEVDAGHMGPITHAELVMPKLKRAVMRLVSK